MMNKKFQCKTKAIKIKNLEAISQQKQEIWKFLKQTIFMRKNHQVSHQESLIKFQTSHDSTILTSNLKESQKFNDKFSAVSSLGISKSVLHRSKRP